VTLTGGADVQGLTLVRVDVALTGRAVALRYPVGGLRRASNKLGEVKTRSNVDLTLTGRLGDLRLGGTVTVQRALYDADIFVGTGLIAPDAPPALASAPSPFLQSIAIDV